MAQRRIKIPDTRDVSEVARMAEAAMKEMADIIDRKSIQNFLPSDVSENLQWLDESTNTLYIYNTLTTKWLYMAMTEV